VLVRGQEISLRSIVESWVGIVGGTVAILAAIGTFALWAIGHFQSAQNAAWMSWQIAHQTATAMRNRVNDCDIRKESPPPLTRLEWTACKQYGDEFEQAAAAEAKALDRAKELSR
jgi:hypothetical protein